LDVRRRGIATRSSRTLLSSRIDLVHPGLFSGIDLLAVFNEFYVPTKAKACSSHTDAFAARLILSSVSDPGDDHAHVLMLLAAVRGGVSRLMPEVLEDHIRLTRDGTGKESRMPSAELA
jgi:hypothetical protein